MLVGKKGCDSETGKMPVTVSDVKMESSDNINVNDIVSVSFVFTHLTFFMISLFINQLPKQKEIQPRKRYYVKILQQLLLLKYLYRADCTVNAKALL